MTNHIHLVGVPRKEESLGLALRDAHTVYAEESMLRYNWAEGVFLFGKKKHPPQTPPKKTTMLSLGKVCEGTPFSFPKGFPRSFFPK